MNVAFKNISKIKFEGPKSQNPLAFKHYNPAEVVQGKTMREHLSFLVVYWHTFRRACSHILRHNHPLAGRRLPLGGERPRLGAARVRVHRNTRRLPKRLRSYIEFLDEVYLLLRSIQKIAIIVISLGLIAITVWYWCTGHPCQMGKLITTMLMRFLPK